MFWNCIHYYDTEENAVIHTFTTIHDKLKEKHYSTLNIMVGIGTEEYLRKISSKNYLVNSQSLPYQPNLTGKHIFNSGYLY